MDLGGSELPWEFQRGAFGATNPGSGGLGPEAAFQLRRAKKTCTRLQETDVSDAYGKVEKSRARVEVAESWTGQGQQERRDGVTRSAGRKPRGPCHLSAQAPETSPLVAGVGGHPSNS